MDTGLVDEPSERHRNVGRHGYTPTVSTVTSDIERDVYRGGYGHSAERGDGREASSPRFAELAFGEFAFDLKSNDEEEQRHQAVVDNVTQVEAQPVARCEAPRQIATASRRSPSRVSSPKQAR